MKNEYPVQGKCLQYGVVYQATATREDDRVDTYTGLSEPPFKDRFSLGLYTKQQSLGRMIEWTRTLGFQNPLLKIDSETTNRISKLEILKLHNFVKKHLEITRPKDWI